MLKAMSSGGNMIGNRDASTMGVMIVTWEQDKREKTVSMGVAEHITRETDIHMQVHHNALDVHDSVSHHLQC